MSKRYLGELGESTLRKWASQVGIAAHKADPDRTGWDFFLEFPDPDSSERIRITLPLDKLPRPIQCLVQVKSTDRRSGKRSVKLSNWLRLVKSPLPAFFLVLEFDSKDDCQRAYLVHIDKTYIYRVLKRLHQLDSNMRTQLHKITLQFKWGEENKLSSLSGKGLDRAIGSHVEDLQEYAVQKSEVLRTAGYEDGKWKLDFVIPPPPDGTNIQELLVDLSLGLVPHLDVIRGSATDFRFGIPASEPTETFEGGKVEIVSRQVAGPGTILLTSPDGKSEARLPCDVYLPQGIGFELERKHFKARFAAPFVDFIFWPQVGKADFRYELPEVSEKYSLMQLQPVAQLLLILHAASIGSGRIGFEARFDSRPLFAGYIDVKGGMNKQVVDYATAMVHAWTIVKHFDVDQIVELKPIELLRQEKRLMFIASVLSPTYPPVKILYWSSEIPSDGNKSMCLPYVMDALIGPYRVAVAVAIIGQPVETGQTRREEIECREFQIDTHDVRLCREYCCGRDETPRYSLKDLAQSVVEEYEDTTDILIIEGTNDFLTVTQR